MPDASFTITRKNNATEKEGIQYMESLNRGYFFVDKDERNLAASATSSVEGSVNSGAS